MDSVYGRSFSLRCLRLRPISDGHAWLQSALGGYHSSTGIAIGAGAAAGIGIGYLVLRNHNHNHAKISGCLQASDHAETLLDDQNNTYNLINSESVPLKSGERVELRGKRVRSPGTLAFEVQGMVKDYGQCRQ
jgi:hypothetical protein